MCHHQHHHMMAIFHKNLISLSYTSMWYKWHWPCLLIEIECVVNFLSFPLCLFWLIRLCDETSSWNCYSVNPLTSIKCLSETLFSSQELLGAGILFYIFCVIAVASLAFIYLIVPETKGLTLEEIEAKCL